MDFHIPKLNLISNHHFFSEVDSISQTPSVRSEYT